MLTTLLATEPETYGQRLKRSLAIYQRSILHVFLLSLLLSIVISIPRLFTFFVGGNIFETVGTFNLSRLWVVLLDVVGLFFFVAMLWRMRCVITEAHERIADDMKVAFKKIGFIIGAALIQMFIISIITFTVIIFMYYLNHEQLLFRANRFGSVVLFLVLFFHLAITLYIFFLLSLYLPLIVTEDKGILSSLKKSAVLVWSHWWQTVVFLVTPFFIYLICIFVVKFGFQINLEVYFLMPVIKLSISAIILHIVILALFMPWIASCLLVQLRDLELRKTNLRP